ncbi:hypothetical protein IAT40_005484 [Kwoniella sp. CBS 6097]
MSLTPPPTAATILRLSTEDDLDDAAEPAPGGQLQLAVTQAEIDEPDIYFDVEEDSEHHDLNAGLNTSAVASGLGTLHILPPSPAASESSLTSEEVSFDHNAPVPSTITGTSTSVQAGPVPSSSRHGRRGSSGETRPPTLGLRDLVKMHKRDKLRRAQNFKTGSDSIYSCGSRQVQIHDSTSAISLGANAALDDNEVPPYPGDEIATGAGRILDAGTSDGGEVFAKQVAIRGWKIVGGSSWTDGGKLGAYVVYDIDIGLKNGGNMSILRRYNDFVRLRSDLLSKYPTLEGAIPPLPGKAHFSRFSTKFLEERQPRLQRFLKAVVLHPEMGKGGTDSVVGRWVMGDGG